MIKGCLFTTKCCGVYVPFLFEKDTRKRCARHATHPPQGFASVGARDERAGGRCGPAPPPHTPTPAHPNPNKPRSPEGSARHAASEVADETAHDYAGVRTSREVGGRRKECAREWAMRGGMGGPRNRMAHLKESCRFWCVSTIRNRASSMTLFGIDT